MRLGSLILAAFLICSTASAQFGPPQTRATNQGCSLGVGLHNVQSEWTYDYTIARNRIYVEGSFGLSDCSEIFGRVGGSNWVINDVHSFQAGRLHDVSSDGYPAFLSGGMRGTAWGNGAWSIGISLEVAVYSGMEQTIRWTYNTYQELHFDPTVEINGGISIGYNLEQGVLYGGPLIHFGYAMADIRTHTFGSDWAIRDTIDGLTIRDKAGVGCFVGWQRPIGGRGWTLQLEGSVLRGGFGGALSCFWAW
jgi:hypothetical protein